MILLAVLVFFAVIRIRLLDIPLERDEGEYAYFGQLILQGIPPFKLAYNMKLPGTYAAYAVIMALFGQTPSGIHFGLLLVNAATSILIFFLAKRLLDEPAGFVAAAAYALISAGIAVMGFQAHATHFVALTAVAGILIFVRNTSRRLPGFFWSGLLLGVAFVMKQPGLFFVLFVGTQILFEAWRRKDRWRSSFLQLGVFALGAALPFGISCAVLWACGVFSRFWFWTFDYARAYGGANSLNVGLELFEWNAVAVIAPGVGIWILAAIGAVAVTWDRDLRPRSFFYLSFLFFSFLAVCPGLYFRPHYFILFLPAVALLAAVAVQFLRRRFTVRWPKSAFVPAALFLAVFSYGVLSQWEPYFKMDPVSACRLIYQYEPFPEARDVAEYVRSNTNASDRIAVLGSDPEIYFYAQRHSATGYLYAFPFGESQPFAAQMQEQMIGEIEAARPPYIIAFPAAWIMGGTRGDKERAEWAQQYLQDYELVALVDHIGENMEFHILQQGATREELTHTLFGVYRRRAFGPVTN